MNENLDSKETSSIAEDSKRAILLDAGLFIEDPINFPGLALRMDPESGLDLDFAAIAYDTSSTTQEQVRCSVCEKRQWHNHGFIIKLKSGHVGLVGRDCGEKHFFGEDGWVELKAKTKRLTDQALVTARWGTAKHRLVEVNNHLQKWSDELEVLDQAQSEFAEAFPHLAKSIRRELNDGKLTFEREIKRQHVNRNGDHEEWTDFVIETIARVEADWFFCDEQLHPIIGQQMDNLDKVASALRADMTSYNVIACNRSLREARHALEDIAAKSLMFSQLSREDKWKQVAQWAELHKVRYAPYRVENGVIKNQDTRELRGEFRVPKKHRNINSNWDKALEVWPVL